MTTSENRLEAMAQAPHATLEETASGAWKPSAVQGIFLIVRRELSTYFRSRSGYLISGLVLFVNGLFFNGYAVGSSPKYSTDVLSDFFYYSFGFTMAAALFLSMRLIVEDRESGALPLLTTSSLTDGQIVFAKYLSGVLFLAVLLATSIYMPLLIFINGKVSVGHIVAGYVGLLSIGSATIAIGTFGSAIAASQVVAIVISAVISVFLLLLWMLARVIEGPLSDVVSYLALYEKHFRPFQSGTISLRDALFYLSVSAFFLFLARNALEGRRWRP